MSNANLDVMCSGALAERCAAAIGRHRVEGLAQVDRSAREFQDGAELRCRALEAEIVIIEAGDIFEEAALRRRQPELLAEIVRPFGFRTV